MGVLVGRVSWREWMDGDVNWNVGWELPIAVGVAVGRREAWSK